MPILSIAFSLAITLAIETGIYMILKHRDLKLLLIVTSLNVVLNPLMNIILIYLVHEELTYWIILAIYEILTILVEALVISFFMKFKYLKVLIFAFIANLISFLVGLMLQPVYEILIALIILMSFFFSVYIFTYLFVLIFYIKTNKKCLKDDENIE